MAQEMLLLGAVISLGASFLRPINAKAPLLGKRSWNATNISIAINRILGPKLLKTQPERGINAVNEIRLHNESVTFCAVLSVSTSELEHPLPSSSSALPHLAHRQYM